MPRKLHVETPESDPLVLEILQEARRDRETIKALVAALEITAGNIRSLGPAGALAPTFECYRPWLDVVETAIAAARTP